MKVDTRKKTVPVDRAIRISTQAGDDGDHPHHDDLDARACYVATAVPIRKQSEPICFLYEDTETEDMGLMVLAMRGRSHD